MLAVRELTRYSSAPGQEGSRAEKHGRVEVFLVCLVAELKKGGEGGQGGGIGKGRKRGKREEK